MSKRTPEPWALFEVGDGRPHLCPASESDKMSILTIAEEDGVTFACVYKDSDARRIVTCVNACAGMTDPAAEIAELKRQRDELLALAERLVQWDLDYPVNCYNGYAGLQALNAIIRDNKVAITKGPAS